MATHTIVFIAKALTLYVAIFLFASYNHYRLTLHWQARKFAVIL